MVFLLHQNFVLPVKYKKSSIPITVHWDCNLQTDCKKNPSVDQCMNTKRDYYMDYSHNSSLELQHIKQIA